MDQNTVFIRVHKQESLSNRCLLVVANNFNKINIEQIKVLPINLINKLTNIVSKRGLLNDTNIHLFLNEQTKVLELSECDSISDFALRKLTACKYLVKLDLNSNRTERVKITSLGITRLAQDCKYLQVILLRRCINVDDTCIDTFARNCPKLTSINIANCPFITDNSLVSLGKYCLFLKSINLSGTQISDQGVFSLMTPQVSQKIEEIHIAHCNLITDESIECILLNSKRIKYLLFHSCPNVTDASRLALENYMTDNTNQKVKHLTWTIY